MKSAVFISTGIGNALLQIPLARELARRGPVTAVATSPFDSEKIFAGFSDQPYSSIVNARDFSGRLRLGLSSFRKYDLAVVDYFAGTKANAVLASLIAKKTVTNQPLLKQYPLPNLKYMEPVEGMHETLQQLRLVSDAVPSGPEMLDSMRCKPKKPSGVSILPPAYITWQPGSGNGKAPWKYWPAERWTALFERIRKEGFTVPVVALGDKDDLPLKQAMANSSIPFVDLIGKTNLEDLPYLISNALVHMGTDSSAMHMAAVVGTPTFTVWGGSDPGVYGYKVFDKQRHETVIAPTFCWPCNRYLAPNRKRVASPEMCRDQFCIKDIAVDNVYNHLKVFMKKLNLP